MLENEWSEPDESIAFSSCLTGGGAHTKYEFFHFEFPAQVLDICKDINQLECVVLTVAVARWAFSFRHKKLQLNCNNLNTVRAINGSTSRDSVIQACLRYLHKIMACESIDIRAKFLRGVHNRIADNLSRWHLNVKYRKEFEHKNNQLKLKEVKITNQEFNFLF